MQFYNRTEQSRSNISQAREHRKIQLLLFTPCTMWQLTSISYYTAADLQLQCDVSESRNVWGSAIYAYRILSNSKQKFFSTRTSFLYLHTWAERRLNAPAWWRPTFVKLKYIKKIKGMTWKRLTQENFEFAIFQAESTTNRAWYFIFRKKERKKEIDISTSLASSDADRRDREQIVRPHIVSSHL